MYILQHATSKFIYIHTYIDLLVACCKTMVCTSFEVITKKERLFKIIIGLYLEVLPFVHVLLEKIIDVLDDVTLD